MGSDCLTTDPALRAYTDRSKHSGLVGFGASITLDRFQWPTFVSGHLGPYSTVFVAEVLAIKRAAEVVQDDLVHHGRPEATKLKIFSDSQAALKALVSNQITSNYVLSNINALYSLSNYITVELFWIKAHV